jgi:hypothetical protein
MADYTCFDGKFALPVSEDCRLLLIGERTLYASEASMGVHSGTGPVAQDIDPGTFRIAPFPNFNAIHGVASEFVAV